MRWEVAVRSVFPCLWHRIRIIPLVGGLRIEELGRTLSWSRLADLFLPYFCPINATQATVNTVTANQSDALQTEFQAGKAAFERGEYRKSVEHLERSLALVNPNSALGGTVQTWLVTAYQAVGQQQEAIALCRTLTQHPDLKTRKEGKRILYILEAPKLQTRPEWLTQIPDLGNLADQGERNRVGGKPLVAPPKRSPVETPRFKVEPVDLSQVNTEDNRFIWVALVAVLLLLGGLTWLM